MLLWSISRIEPTRYLVEKEREAEYDILYARKKSAILTGAQPASTLVPLCYLNALLLGPVACDVGLQEQPAFAALLIIRAVTVRHRLLPGPYQCTNWARFQAHTKACVGPNTDTGAFVVSLPSKLWPMKKEEGAPNCSAEYRSVKTEKAILGRIDDEKATLETRSRCRDGPTWPSPSCSTPPPNSKPWHVGCTTALSAATYCVS
jgi:hypothetical protein